MSLLGIELVTFCLLVEVIAMDVKLIIQLLEEMTAIYTEEKNHLLIFRNCLMDKKWCMWFQWLNTNNMNGKWFMPRSTTFFATLLLARSNASSRTILQLNKRAIEGKRKRRKSKQWEPISIFTNCKSCCESNNWVTMLYC